MFVACLGEDRLVTASSDMLIWCRVRNSAIEEVHRSFQEGRSFSLFPIRDHVQAVLQLEQSPRNHSLQLVDGDGLKGRPISIPLYNVHQVTVDSSASLLAVYGSVSSSGRAGYIDPVESCLIDAASGDLQRLPYSAVAISGDALYFAKDRTVYKRTLAFRRSAHVLDATFSGDPLEVIASDKVLLIAPSDDCVWLATEHGLFAANSMDVTLVHKWDCAGRVCACEGVFFAAGIGPELQVYDVQNHVATHITSSSKTQITGFDALCLSRKMTSPRAC